MNFSYAQAPMIVDQHIYRKAFQEYLRKGTPIMWSIKQERPTTHYIWRTCRDGKVRSSHVEREGQVFSWDDPPEGGHPGEDYNCRCTAGPFFDEVSEYIELSIDGIGTKSGWDNNDFVNHYFNGRGRGVTLPEIGHSRKIIEAFIDLRGEAIKQQTARAARTSRSGSVSYNFVNTYDMTGVVFAIADTTIGGSFSGQSSEKNGILTIEGDLDFYLDDEFTDPLDIGIEVDDYSPGSILYDNIHKPLHDDLRGRVGLPSNGRQRLGVREGVPYSITGQWSGSLEGQIYADPARIRYR
ncbi:SPP1 gp7 family putative phage head morphogenesis protein [Roseinatronobacter thiooxidans]|uniref:SPP1 gp7 family putative phage head morphogenesis protein n=1 Tax=Roseinatronobacter thiooxidans TaxID=121821 RepID=A0A2W7Q8F4_9RHOB|nr:minor capsid protein [Roseinatronobacter thiooxidans]PZX44501.1 SPP1 gp7 family putative phage head morphogenesis protein [Roseinatronobacter thiooxidans]